jgi:hypothetical protein
MQRSPSPSPEPPAYRPMEPSDPADSPWGHWETPCAIHGMGPCPYPVAQRQPVLSSPGMREGEEGVTDEDVVVEVIVAEEEDDDEPIEVIPVPDSTPPRSAYKQTVRIRIGPWGRPTETLALRTGAGEAGRISPEIGSEVWLPPPPPPPGRAVRNEQSPPPPPTVAMTPPPPPPPPPLQQEHITPPPLLSHVGGRILCRFVHLANPSRWVIDWEIGNSRTSHERHIEWG